MGHGGGGRRSPPLSRGGGGRGADGASLRRSRRFVRCPSPVQAGRSAVPDLYVQEAMRHSNVPLHLLYGSPMQARVTFDEQESFDAAAARVAAWQQSRFSSPGSLLEEGEVSPGFVPASLCGASVHALAAGLGVDPVVDASPCTPSTAHQPLTGSWSVVAACNLAQVSSCMPTVRRNDARCCPVSSGTVTPSAVMPPAGIGDPGSGVSGVDGFMVVAAPAVGVGLMPEASLHASPTGCMEFSECRTAGEGITLPLSGPVIPGPSDCSSTTPADAAATLSGVESLGCSSALPCSRKSVEGTSDAVCGEAVFGVQGVCSMAAGDFLGAEGDDAGVVAESIPGGSFSCIPPVCHNALSCCQLQDGPVAPPILSGCVGDDHCLVEGAVLRHSVEVLSAGIGDILVGSKPGTAVSFVGNDLALDATSPPHLFVPSSISEGVELCVNAMVNSPLKVGTGAALDVPNPISSQAGPGLTTNLSRAAWARPPVIPLPRCAQLGDAAVINNIVQLDAAAVNSNLQKFDNALVGRLFGRKYPFHFLNFELKKRWERFGSFKHVSINAECFICFFDNSTACDAILTGGPWVVAGQVLGLDRWTPSFSPSSRDGLLAPIWVRMPDLPFYCWDASNIARITSYIGEPLWIDAATDRLERGSFARACVRLDLAKPLRNGVWIQGLQGQFFQPFEYEGISSLCFKCGCVGHKAHLCGVSVGNTKAKQAGSALHGPQGDAGGQTLSSQVVTDELVGEEHPPSHCPSAAESGKELDAQGVGPWVLVARKRRRNRRGIGPDPTAHLASVRSHAGGSRSSVQNSSMEGAALAMPGGAAVVYPNLGSVDGRVLASSRPAAVDGRIEERELVTPIGGGDASPFWPP